MVVNVERRPTRFADEIFVPSAAGAVVLVLERRSGRYGGGVDDALHRLGFLALPEDHAHRGHCSFRRALVLPAAAQHPR